jgi:hypothetical protein
LNCQNFDRGKAKAQAKGLLYKALPIGLWIAY